jgi:hypothetical protein
MVNVREEESWLSFLIRSILRILRDLTCFHYWKDAYLSQAQAPPPASLLRPAATLFTIPGSAIDSHGEHH